MEICWMDADLKWAGQWCISENKVVNSTQALCFADTGIDFAIIVDIDTVHANIATPAIETIETFDF